ncbi:hypothetical protein Shyhy01_76300 [Streptomyces hygroscopicus subsp. hygroscopicus]|nr:hypothetical protein [Streptomyces hygroscopicus]GLX54681.1 hypothetical protein Shyhy01_76300 [Streptomyces hygroscopicus subsp. hygroscopicus]
MGDQEDDVRLWDVAAGRQSAAFTTPAGRAVVFSPDGRLPATADEPVHLTDTTQPLRLWDTRSGFTRIAEHHVVLDGPVVFSADGRTLAAATSESTEQLWDTATGRARATLTVPPGTARWSSARTGAPWPPAPRTAPDGCGTWPPDGSATR